jgi:hypothetical protein
MKKFKSFFYLYKYNYIISYYNKIKKQINQKYIFNNFAPKKKSFI